MFFTHTRTSQVVLMVKSSPAMQETTYTKDERIHNHRSSTARNSKKQKALGRRKIIIFNLQKEMKSIGHNMSMNKNAISLLKNLFNNQLFKIIMTMYCGVCNIIEGSIWQQHKILTGRGNKSTVKIPVYCQLSSIILFEGRVYSVKNMNCCCLVTKSRSTLVWHCGL